VNKKDKILTYQQAKDLIFFIRNVVGVRQDMYAILDLVKSFDERLKRLEKTCDLIEAYFRETGASEELIAELKTSPFKTDWNKEECLK